MAIDKRFFTVNQLNAGDLADEIGGTVIGDRSVEIHDAAPISACTAGDLTFFSSAKADVLPCGVKGYIVITTEDGSKLLPPEVVALVVDVPRLRFADAMKLLVEDAFAGPVKPAVTLNLSSC